MKQYLCFIGTMYFAFSSFAKAECTLETVNDVDCFKCGNNCVAHVTYTDELQEDGTTKSIGTMELSGTGDMGGWNESLGAVRPWYSIKNDIHNIKINEGITSVGVNAFYDFDNLTNIELPQSLEKIRVGGLESCPLIQHITIPENTIIENQSLDLTGLTSVIISKGVQLSSGAFTHPDGRASTPLVTLYCPVGMEDSCEKAIAYRQGEAKVEVYTKDKDGSFFFKNKWYASQEDMLAGKHIKKLRYTVEEAMKATEKGDKFHVFLTYK